MELRQQTWSELQPDILSAIAGRLEHRRDLQHFRSVCKQWRSSFSISSEALESLPLLHPLLPLEFPDVPRQSDDELSPGDFFSSIAFGNPLYLVANAVYLVRPPQNSGSSKPFLINVEEFNKGKFYLRLPLTRTRIEGFNLNVLGSDASLVAKGYSIRIPAVDDFDEDGTLDRDKVVLFTNPASESPLTTNDCTAMVLFRLGSLAWARFSRGRDWSYLSKFDDIVEFDCCVYAIDCTGKLRAIHYDSVWPKGRKYYQVLKVDCVVNDPICSGCYTERRKRLAVDSSSGVIYLVHSIVEYGEKIHFRVYKLDKGCCKWEEINGLGEDRILFAGVDGCFFMSVNDFPGCRGNCIVFHKDCFLEYEDTSFSESFFEQAKLEFEIGVFHFGDGETRLISAFPGYSDILWPPPAWLRSDSSPSFRLRITPSVSY